jgi:hypothetical protein
MAEDNDLDLGLDDIIDLPPKKEVKKKAAAKKPAAPVEAVLLDDLDPEYDRANWPTIIIDFEQDKPNYEFVAAHGTCKNGDPFGWDMQIQRGVEVKVPPSIVYALRDARSTHFTQVTDPLTGTTSMRRQDRSAIPWSLVSGGKYIR